jgi:hypothetical protein
MLLGYDGSSEAAHAIARAGELFPRRRAVLVHAWSPFRSVWNVEAGWPNIDDGPLRLSVVPEDVVHPGLPGCLLLRSASEEGGPDESAP